MPAPMPTCFHELSSGADRTVVICVNVCGDRDKAVVNRYLLSVLVRLFLEQLEQSILKFVADFSRLTVSDEKVNELVSRFADNVTTAVSLVVSCLPL